MRAPLVLILAGCTQDFGAFQPRGDADASADAAVDQAPDAPSLPETGACMNNGITFRGHCYWAIAAVTFDQANNSCKAAGAHVVTFTDAIELQAVMGVGTGERWIGLQRTSGPASDMSYTWVTGEPRGGFHNWASSEPNGSGGCVCMLGNGQWNDLLCTEQRPAICERD